jgi:alanyl-tRNA synthetase
MAEEAVPTTRLYFDDPYLLEFEARVLDRLEREGQPAIVLDQTAFYAEAGGQPWDLGTLAGAAVLRVLDEDGRIVHVLDRPAAGDVVRGSVDGARRFDHMQQHTGQHILSQAFLDVLHGETRSFHMGDSSSSLEIGLAAASEESLERVERRANQIVFQDRPVKTYFVEPERLSEVPLRRPPKVSGTIRVVEVEDFDYSACGGTHVRRTGEIGLIKITSQEKIRGNLRFDFLCGGRALADYRIKDRLVRGLAARFNAAAGDVSAAVDKLAADLKSARRALRTCEERAAGLEARELAGQARGRIISGVYSDRSPEAVRSLALALVKMGEFVVLLACRSDTRSHLVLARSESLPLDLRTLVPVLGPIVRGKGGGSSGLVEMAGEREADLDAALARAEEDLAD